MRVEERVYQRTVDAIYDAAVSADNWSVALEHIARIFESQTAALITRDLTTMTGSAVNVGSDAAAVREYFSVWRHRNILVNNTKAWRPGSVETDRQMVSRSDLERSDYFNEYMKHYDADRVLRLSLLTEDRVHQSISLSRHDSIGEYQAPDVELGQRLMPHLQRAARIGWQVQRADLIRSATAELMEDNPVGVVLFNRDGRVAFANRAARAMAARGDAFVIRQGKVIGLSLDNDRQLRQLIGAALAHTLAHIEEVGSPRGGVARLKRKSGARDYVVTAGPLAVGVSSLKGVAPAGFLLVSDSEAGYLPRRAMLQRAFNLTGTEARLAIELAGGHSIERAAEALDIRISTARWHLAALFRKTGTTRQTELIRVLLLLPWKDGGAG
jgi:DNA-binding CsgD family transcriptional regulator